MGATNVQILEALANFRKESGEQREAIISGINDLNLKVAVQNGRVGRLEGDAGKIDGRMTAVEKMVWRWAGGLAALIFIIEIGVRLIK